MTKFSFMMKCLGAGAFLCGAAVFADTDEKKPNEPSADLQQPSSEKKPIEPSGELQQPSGEKKPIEPSAKLEQPAGQTGAMGTGEKDVLAQFDQRIDSWAVGTVQQVDATKNELTIRGLKMPYASTFARMQKDIHDQIETITDPAQKQAKEEEVRKSWQDKLTQSLTADPGKEGELLFRFERNLLMMPEEKIANVDFLHRDNAQVASSVIQGEQKSDTPMSDVSKTPGAGSQPDAADQNLTLAQLKVGDQVIVGYDAGLIAAHEGHALIKKSSSAAAPAKPVEEKTVPDPGTSGSKPLEQKPQEPGSSGGAQPK